MALNPTDLAHYERPARIFCAKTGVNPDDMVPGGPAGLVLVGQAPTRPRWHAVAEQMISLSLMMVSLQEAAATVEAMAATLRPRH